MQLRYVLICAITMICIIGLFIPWCLSSSSSKTIDPLLAYLFTTLNIVYCILAIVSLAPRSECTTAAALNMHILFTLISMIPTGKVIRSYSNPLALDCLPIIPLTIQLSWMEFMSIFSFILLVKACSRIINSPNVIDNTLMLDRIVVRQNYECSICISNITCNEHGIIEEGQLDQGKCIYILLCEHGFHPSCINPWLLQNNTCPNCRAGVVSWFCYSLEK